MAMAPTKSLPIDQFLIALAAKQPTPGGGAAVAISAAVGAAAASMAAAYTTRKKDFESKCHLWYCTMVCHSGGSDSLDIAFQRVFTRFQVEQPPKPLS